MLTPLVEHTFPSSGYREPILSFLLIVAETGEGLSYCTNILPVLPYEIDLATSRPCRSMKLVLGSNNAAPVMA